MNFFLDHDVPADVGRVLRLKGHTVQFLHEALPIATDDLQVMRHGARHRMVIITCNRDDFLNLAKTEPRAGIIVLVRRRTRVAECAARSVSFNVPVKMESSATSTSPESFPAAR